MKTIILAAVVAVSASAAHTADTSAPAAALSDWQRVDCAAVSATAGLAAGGTQIALRPGCYVRLERYCGTYNHKRYCRTVRREVCVNPALSRLDGQPSAVARASA